MNRLNSNELRELQILCNKYGCDFANTLSLVEGNHPEENFMLGLIKEDTNPATKTTREKMFPEFEMKKRSELQRFFDTLYLCGDVDQAMHILSTWERQDRKEQQKFRKEKRRRIEHARQISKR